MIVLLVGVTVLAVTGLGWYGHKASVRIATWGRNMNEQDGIFQAMADQEEWAEPEDSRSRNRGRVGQVQAVGGHLSAGAPSK
jgi:hypothetical protein